MPVACDYHLHTPRCKHARGPLEAYVERALALGLEEVGFSDHNPLPDGLSHHVRMDEWELADYVAEIQQLRERYRGRITVRLGLELDYLAGREPYLQRQVDAHPWDYIIGSVHYLDADCRIGSWSRQSSPADVDAHYARYFERVRQLAASGLCDIIAHFDIPKRSMRPPNENQAAAIEETLATLRREDVSLEINTSGYRHAELADPAPYPGWETVARAAAHGVALSVNSDGHDPAHVGTEFDSVARRLRELGVRELARFSGRRRSAYPLA